MRDSLCDEVDRIVREGVSEKDFQRIRKSTYGLMIRDLNNVESVANLMINAHMEGVSPYEAISVLSEMKCSDVYEFIRSDLCRDRLVLSVIEGTDK